MTTTSVATSYRTLQLRPGAARDLVEEAYWTLTSELKLAHTPEPAFSERMAELNSAYEEITSLPVQFASPPKPLRRRRRLYLGGTRVETPRGNFYDLLHVDETAVESVVRVATRHLLNRRSGASSADRMLREAASRACDVLTDPVLRREYDSRLGIRPCEPAEREEGQHIALPAPLDEQRAADEPGSAREAVAGVQSGRAGTITERDGERDAPPTPLDEQHKAGASRPAKHAAASVRPDHAGATAEIVASWAERVQAIALAASLDEQRGDDASAPSGLPDGSLPEEPAALSAPSSQQQSVVGNEHAPRPHLSAINGYLSRLTLHRGRRSQVTTSLDAESERLLSLREDMPDDLANADVTAASAVRPEPAAHADPPAPGPRVVFDSGPLAGTTLPIPHEDDAEGVDVHLSGDDGIQTDLRVVRRGDAYMLVHLDGPTPSVGGQEIVLPVIVLEDGDTICTGTTSARFTLS